MSNSVNIVLNGEIIRAYSDETILEVANRNNIQIPTLCNDPRIEPYTSCYVCVVEVEGMKGLQPSCSTKVREGMVIKTENDKVKKARKTALDLLLSNHYADCSGPCKQTCPAGVDVQGYISLIEKGLYNDAIALIKEVNPLPAICGRVCVRPCEVACRRNLLDEGTGVGIDYLKRFAADKDLESIAKFIPKIKSSTNKKVAVIGAGPGGLSAAYFLQIEGHQADIYEAAPKAGGWLRYGIPEYRLPNDVVQSEVDNITELGVKIFYNKTLGGNVSYKAIKEKYDAVVLTIGSQKGTSVGCEGDDAENVFSGIDFLKKMEVTSRKYNFTGKTVAVVGGGNTAMDCCRTSIRCGAKKVYVVYRRTENEMPANPIEIHESKLEGVEYLFLTNPTRINKDKEGKLKTMTCIKMELGDADASGRRRPIPIDGSEFDIKLDYILAAVGQKTNVMFLEDINNYINDGELKLSKWHDLDCDKNTLQTGVKSIFAAGDGVTGPGTLIQAISQAKIAALSCHQFLMGLPIEPVKKEFLSKKDNFKLQIKEEYNTFFPKQLREEMPTLNPKHRINFNEVELGYKNEETAKHEANRCLECGCTEYFTCDLKKYATEYNADQLHFEGEFSEHSVNFDHPFIEIDNNKCILCSRCVRICKEVVGANALGLVERGFKTYVAPSLGDKLQDTSCESCGMCISTCPTGAITENVYFKPGPVKTNTFETICNYCSVGCNIVIHHTNGFVMKVTGAKGMVNPDGNICKYAKFGYKYLNDKKRITKPLLKTDGKFEEISFKQAYDYIVQKIRSVEADENAFFAGARLTNEEIYLIQKIARAGAKTNNISSMHYIKRGAHLINTSFDNAPFSQIKDASKIYLFGAEINTDNPVVGYMVNNTRYTKKIQVEVLTTLSNNSMSNKVDRVIKTDSYYYFIKAINYYLLKYKLYNALYINDNCVDFEAYKDNLLKENYDELIKLSGLTANEIANCANDYNMQMNAIILFSEKEISAPASTELYNLTMITGKLGKTSNGLIALKTKNNSQGLFDMGAYPKFGVGYQEIDNKDFVKKMERIWGVSGLSTKHTQEQELLLREGKIKNVFIFGEDPIGCAIDKENLREVASNGGFGVVQDYFMTETAQLADLVLPASLPFEIGGHFTNTQRYIQRVNQTMPSSITETSYMQLFTLLKKLGVNTTNDVNDVMMEVISLLPDIDINEDRSKYRFIETKDNNYKALFNHACDNVVKYFDNYFDEKIKY
ncbi:MAG: FAD-dependent oxidoreductase [Bacteroidetes bacterium]|nr:FAD-dependent oxidoreductase [Bacteroidota bacterium]